MLGFALTLSIAFLLSSPPECASEGVSSIAASKSKLVISLEVPQNTKIRLVELRSYEVYSPTEEYQSLWEGFPDRPIKIHRYDKHRDRLYAKFLLVRADDGSPVGSPRYVDDLSNLKPRDFLFFASDSIKGLSLPSDLDDVRKLGARHVVINLLLNGLLDRSNLPSKESWTVDGEKTPINIKAVENLDRQVLMYTQAGLNVTLILLNGVPTQPDPENPMIHPLTDLEKAPFHLGAFNVEDERGLRVYRALVEYIAERYSRPDAKYGWVSGYIVGNEVQAHYTWYNIGKMPMDRFVDHYHRVLRITDLAARRIHSRLRVYASMEHHWNIRFSSPLESFKGKEFIDSLNGLSKREGDFPWHLAFHPYPENLFNPRVWEDKTALPCYDSPRITFKNLEILPAYFRQDALLYKGAPRRIILSEQGFHAAPGPEGEADQAAAFAYAFYKTSRIPGIDAFMYYRHVSSKKEFGLRLGLWTGDTENPDEKGMGRKLPIHDVFEKAGTEDEVKAFEFAKKIVGIKQWEEILPSTDDSLFAKPCQAQLLDASGTLVFDFTENVESVEPSNCASWRRDLFFDAVGYRPSIFHHPKDLADSDAVFLLCLPSLDSGRALVLKLGATLTYEGGDGVRFSILIEGNEIWSCVKEKMIPSEHTIDISSWAGKSVKIVLRVHPRNSLEYDWANWIWPRIMVLEMK